MKCEYEKNTHDMSIDKLPKFLSQIMDFCSTFLLFGYGIFRTFWCVCGLLSGLGDIGCAVFIVE